MRYDVIYDLKAADNINKFNGYFDKVAISDTRNKNSYSIPFFFTRTDIVCYTRRKF